jgi:RNA recognition motif-containing protein
MNCKLYVGNLNYSTTEEGLAEVFRAAGEVASVRIITDRVTGQSRGFGFVEMATPEAARRAVEELNGTSVDRRNIVVSEAREQERRPGGGRSFGGGGGGGPRRGFRGGRGGGRGGGGGGGGDS